VAVILPTREQLLVADLDTMSLLHEIDHSETTSLLCNVEDGHIQLPVFKQSFATDNLYSNSDSNQRRICTPTTEDKE